MRPERVLLIGGGGFIGTALARRLAAEGCEVHVISRRRVSADISGIHTHAGGLEDRSLLSRLLPLCSTVVHLAAETTPGVSARHPLMEANNILPTLVLLEALQDFPAVHFIYFSSGGTVYGNPDRLPVAEDAPLRPLSYHGAGKVAQEMFLQAFRTQGRVVTVLRPANAYGPGQALRTGFGLVRNVLECIRKNAPVEIWGDGEAVRDFVFVEDVVAACTLLVDRPTDSGTYNIGSGEGCSIGELIACAGRVCGKQPLVHYHQPREGDVARIVLDISRIRALGWAPQIDMDEGISRTWEWLQGAVD